MILRSSAIPPKPESKVDVFEAVHSNSDANSNLDSEPECVDSDVDEALNLNDEASPECKVDEAVDGAGLENYNRRVIDVSLEDGDDSEENEPVQENLSVKTVRELRIICKTMGLKRSGTKNEIIARIEESRRLSCV